MLSIGSASNSGAYNYSTTEVVECALPPTSMPKDCVLVLLLFMCSFSIGTGQTDVKYRIRRGSTTGDVLIFGPLQYTLGAGAYYVHTVMAIDTLISGAQGLWCLTAQGVGNTGAASVISVCGAAIFLQ